MPLALGSGTTRPGSSIDRLWEPDFAELRPHSQNPLARLGHENQTVCRDAGPVGCGERRGWGFVMALMSEKPGRAEYDDQTDAERRRPKATPVAQQDRRRSSRHQCDGGDPGRNPAKSGKGAMAAVGSTPFAGAGMARIVGSTSMSFPAITVKIRSIRPGFVAQGAGMR